MHQRGGHHRNPRSGEATDGVAYPSVQTSGIFLQSTQSVYSNIPITKQIHPRSNRPDSTLFFCEEKNEKLQLRTFLFLSQ